MLTSVSAHPMLQAGAGEFPAEAEGFLQKGAPFSTPCHGGAHPSCVWEVWGYCARAPSASRRHEGHGAGHGQWAREKWLDKQNAQEQRDKAETRRTQALQGGLEENALPSACTRQSSSAASMLKGSCGTGSAGIMGGADGRNHGQGLFSSGSPGLQP